MAISFSKKTNYHTDILYISLAGAVVEMTGVSQLTGLLKWLRNMLLLW